MNVRGFAGMLALASVAMGVLVPGVAVAAPPDTNPPAVTISSQVHLVTGQGLSTGKKPVTTVKAVWTQNDASNICSESGVVYGDYQRPVASFTGVRTRFSFTANTTTYYYLTIKATDCSANKNSSTTTQYFDALSLDQEGAATYSAGWTTATCKCFSGGTDVYTSKKGATATFRYYGEALGFVTEKSPARGSARIYLDGKLQTTLNANTPTITNSVIGFSAYFNDFNAHTLMIVVVSGRIDVDGFLTACC